MRPIELDDLYRLRLASDPRLNHSGTVVAFVVTQANEDNDDYDSAIWVADVDGGDVRPFTQGPSDSAPRWSPDGKTLAFLRKTDAGVAQIHLIPGGGGEGHAVASLAPGVGEPAWAPDGQRIAFTAVMPREAKLGDEPQEIESPGPSHITDLPVRADGSGIDRGFRPHLFVLDLETEDVTQLTAGDFAVGTVSWSPDGDTIAFVSAMHPERGHDLASHVFAIPSHGGKLRRITSGPGIAAFPTWSSDGTSIVFAGQLEVAIDGLTTLLVVDAAGGEPTSLLQGFDRNVMIGAPAYPGAPPQLGSDDSFIYFCARMGGQTHVFRVALEGGTAESVITDDGLVVSGASVTKGLAFVGSTATIPADVYVADADGRDARRVTSLNDEWLADIELAPIARRSFAAPDGTAIEGWLVGDETPGPKPTLLDIHGGPHNAWTPAFAAYDLYHQVLASRGWNVLLINPRGSDGYGLEFMKGVNGGWGRNDISDFLAAIDAVSEDGSADTERFAVTGYSYGGFMTNWLIAHTDRFKAAVSGGCLSDLSSFYGTGDFGAALRMEFGAEIFDKPEILRDLSPISYVQNVSTPVLILHGENDDRCPIGQAEEWFVALRRLGKDAEMVTYPGGSHLFIVLGKPSHRNDYAQRLIDWVTGHV